MALPLGSSFVRIVNGRPELNGGDLNHRIDIWQQGCLLTPPQDSEWVKVYGNRKAGVETRTIPFPDTHVEQRAEFVGRSNLIVTIRYPRPSEVPIFENMRLSYRGLLYVIVLAENVLGADRALVLTCQGLEGNV